MEAATSSPSLSSENHSPQKVTRVKWRRLLPRPALPRGRGQRRRGSLSAPERASSQLLEVTGSCTAGREPRVNFLVPATLQALAPPSRRRKEPGEGAPLVPGPTAGGTVADTCSCAPFTAEKTEGAGLTFRSAQRCSPAEDRLRLLPGAPEPACFPPCVCPPPAPSAPAHPGSLVQRPPKGQARAPGSRLQA